MFTLALMHKGQRQRSKEATEGTLTQERFSVSAA